MKIKIKTTTLLLSGFAALYTCTAAAQIQVSLNENPFGPAKSVKTAIQQELQNIARYTRNEGDELVHRIAQKEGVDPEQIIVGEMLDLLGVTLALKAGPGSEFIYTVPGYPALVNGAARVGGKVIEVPLTEHLENDLSGIAAKVNAKTAAVFLVNPHNPSGTVSDSKAFHKFIHEVSKTALVIVDEAYLEFADQYKERTALHNIKDGDQVLVFRTFAKAYALAGLSIGYAIAPKGIAKYLKAQGLGSTHDLNRLSIAAAKASLADTTYISEVYRHVNQERTLWHKFLEQQHLKHSASQGNFVFFDAQVPHDKIAGYLQDHGIQTGRQFAPYHTWIRISIGLPEENRKIQDLLKEFYKQ